MHAEPTTISRAFPVRKQYAIPSYQRNYVWTRAGQWEPLWDDLRGLSRQTLTKGPGAKPHFLGTIITKQIPAQGFIDRWWVVDGQQRLTTLQILIAAARSAFNERGLAQCASILSNALVVRHVIIFGYGHGLQRAIIDESQHRTPERLIMAQH